MRLLLYISILISLTARVVAQDTVVVTRDNTDPDKVGMITYGHLHSCQFTGFLNEDARFRLPSMAGSVLPGVQECYPFLGKTIYSVNKKSFNRELNIFPVIDVLGSQQFNDETYSFRGALGFGLNFQINDKWQGRAMIAAGAHFKNNNADRFNSILNNYYHVSTDSSNAAIIQPRFRLNYRPTSFFEVQAGIDHHFIGEGNRSMLLSDFGAPRPFVRLRTRFWKIEFSNIYQLLRERTLGDQINKFAATHVLDFHINDNFKIGLFESVVFAPKDTLMNRGFEVEYLNPFLFYRPTEYSIGSQDRLLIGLNTSYQFKEIVLYGQLVIDDFVFDELVNRTRWWASKYGGQIGLKSNMQLKGHEFRWLTELNFARPFTYSHLSDVSVYGNQGMPLAHPLGANFVESFSEARYYINDDLSIGTTIMFAQQGGQNANDSIGFGADIYRSYTDRPYEYGYRIGGDGKMNRLRVTLELNYRLVQNWQLHAFIKPGVEFRETSGQPSVTLPFIFGGIRSQLWNERSFSY